MKKILWIMFLMGGGLLSCAESKREHKEVVKNDAEEKVVDGHNARNSLDYEGTYSGTTPGSDCKVVDLTIVLTTTEYTLRVTPLTEGAKTVVQKGQYTWDRNGTVITLEGAKGIPAKYFVGENHLRQLDKNGKQHQGEEAASYILRKHWNS